MIRLIRAALAALAILVVLAGPARAQSWYRAETAHFVVKSRDSEEATRQFAETMERYDRGLRFLMGLPEDHVEESAANKPVIYRFGDRIDISRMAGRGDAGLAGFFWSRAGESVAYAPARYARSSDSRSRTDRVQSIEQVLLHEYTHYFMLQNYPAAYPRWYSEGYAEMMSTMRFNEDGTFHIGDPPQARGWMIDNFPLLRVEDMLDQRQRLTGYTAYQHYATGWLFSHYLNFDPAREAKLREYLTALGNGEDSLTAGRRIFGDLDAMQRELVRYRRGPYPGYDVRPNVITPPTVTVTRIEGAEAALINEEMELAEGATREEAGDLARRLREGLVRFPDSSHAHELLAFALMRAGDHAAAEEAAARAVELDPDNQNAWLYRARNALKLAREDGAQYDAARRYLVRARQLDPADPRPLIEYYNSYYAQRGGVDLPEAAIAALEQAYDEAGDDTGYRLTLARQLIVEERFAEARTVLLPALYSGHSVEADEEDEFTPERLFDALAAADRTRALELIARAFQEMGEETDSG